MNILKLPVVFWCKVSGAEQRICRNGDVWWTSHYRAAIIHNFDNLGMFDNLAVTPFEQLPFSQYFV